MGKYYRVKLDTPAWLKGAILKQVEKTSNDDKSPNYTAISDLWESFEKNYPNDYEEFAKIVEGNSAFFERVYDIKVLGKVKYLTKEAARAAHDKLYKS